MTERIPRWLRIPQQVFVLLGTVPPFQGSWRCPTSRRFLSLSSETQRTSPAVLLPSSHHVCPVCESWLRAHLGPSESRPVAPGEWPGGPRRRDER